MAIKRKHLPILALLFSMLFGAALLALGYIKLPMLPFDLETTAEQKPAEKTDAGAPQAEPGAGKAASKSETDAGGGAAAFDIAKVSPTGPSVFAGRAEPNSIVTVYADGVAIGTAKADGNGEWSLVVEQPIANVEAELKVTSAPAGSAVAALEPPPAAQPKAEALAEPGKAEAGGTVARKLIDKLEKLVESAREEKAEADAKASGQQDAARTEDGRKAAAGEQAEGVGEAAEEKADEKIDEKVEEKAKPQAPAANGGKKTVTADLFAAKARPDAAAERKAAEAPVPIPVPVMFVYREATFTDEGRRAVKLLLEYVKLKDFRGITVSGHADERGTDELNMDLSADRLDAVASVLKEGGYSGRLQLIPKGEREPFTGVDRSTLGREELFQLDRRVELRSVE